MFELLSYKKKTFKKASLVVHDFVSAKGMYINFIPARDKGGGGERGGGFFIKEQWEKSLLSLGLENSNGYFLHCCA